MPDVVTIAMSALAVGIAGCLVVTEYHERRRKDGKADVGKVIYEDDDSSRPCSACTLPVLMGADQVMVSALSSDGGFTVLRLYHDACASEEELSRSPA